MDEEVPILPNFVGYIIVLGFGAVFSAFTALLTHLGERYVIKGDEDAESFNTAGRSVNTGLIAAVIVSQWTWAATLLESSTVAHQFGISGPFWYAAGASVQVLLFSVIAIQIKRVAPDAHTFVEIIRCRYGLRAHKIFLAFGLTTNVIVTAMLILGGSAVVNRLTGMPVPIAAFLIPVGVIGYTMHGGLLASFISAYLHTAIIHIMLLIFAFTVYAVSPEIGSISRMWELLHELSQASPVEGNAEGSYLTMSSHGGIIFGVINIVGNFGTIFVDQSYWQSAIASRPGASVKGFLIGGLSWFSIPFTLATSLGLASLALKIPFTHKEIEDGLVAPMTIVGLLGIPGAVAILTMLFMAVTSAGSAELIAVSSLFTYDIYATYINPAATSKKLLRVSRMAVFGFGLTMGLLAIGLLEIGLSLGYTYLLMGVIIGSAVVPITLTITWKKASPKPVMAGAVLGFVCGFSAWLITAKSMFGELTMKTTGNNVPLLVGNLTSLGTGALISVIGSLISPSNFDWEVTRTGLKRQSETKSNISTDKQGQISTADQSHKNEINGAIRVKFSSTDEDEDKAVPLDEEIDDTHGADKVSIQHSEPTPEEEQVLLLKALKFSLLAGTIMTVLLCILWPVPLLISQYVFSSVFFAAWVSLSIAWAIVAACVIILMPLIESRYSFMLVIRGLWNDLHTNSRAVEPRGTWIHLFLGFLGGVLCPVVSIPVVYFLDNTIFVIMGTYLGTFLILFPIGIGLLYSASYGAYTVGVLFILISLGCALFGSIFYGRKLRVIHRNDLVVIDNISEHGSKL
jgi:SSS family transporter